MRETENANNSYQQPNQKSSDASEEPLHERLCADKFNYRPVLIQRSRYVVSRYNNYRPLKRYPTCIIKLI